MYDKKLEQLIDAALADGELTQKEKQVLFKKAQEMGIDLDEFEMVLDARLVKKNNTQNVLKSETNSSVSKLQKEISIIISNNDNKEKREAKIKAKIENFPVPNTKDDLFNFVTFSLSKISDDSSSDYSDIYEAKYLECISKAEILFPNDPMFIGVANKYKEIKAADRKRMIKMILGCIIAMVALSAFCFIMSLFE